jgi:HK97 gp10 family phage protein
MKFTGTGAAIKRLLDLPKKVRAKAGRRAIGKAAAVVKKAAQENARRVDDPETGRRISQNIGQRFRSKYARRTGNLMVSVGVLTDSGRIPRGNPDTGPRGNTPHWHILELGGPFTKAEAFLRPALTSSADAAINAFSAELNIQLDKITAESGGR